MVESYDLDIKLLVDEGISRDTVAYDTRNGQMWTKSALPFDVLVMHESW